MEIFSKVVHSLHIEIKLFLNSPKIMCNHVRNLRIGKYAPEGYRLCLEWHPRKYIFCIDYIIPYCIPNIYIYIYFLNKILTYLLT